jgi:hypothetical protein
MRDLLKVQNYDNLYRDRNSGALLNGDINALNEYYMKKQMIKKQNEEKQEVKDRLECLEKNMEEIKTLLLEIAQIRGNNVGN